MHKLKYLLYVSCILEVFSANQKLGLRCFEYILYIQIESYNCFDNKMLDSDWFLTSNINGFILLQNLQNFQNTRGL